MARIDDMLTEYSAAIFEEICNQVNPLPSYQMMNTAMVEILQVLAVKIADAYKEKMRRETALILGLPENASTARIQVASEDMIKEFGTMEEVVHEIDKRLDAKYPLPKQVEPEALDLEDDDFGPIDPSILN